MGFADKLKALFITEEEGSAQKKAAKPTANKKAAANPKNTTSSTAAPAAPVEAQAGKPTAKFMEILFGAMEKHNLDGFDYLEFKESLKSLEKMPMDEQTRFQSAFAMAKTMGATPKKLMDAAAHYLKVLLHEEKKFEQALANQRTQQIGGREKQIKDLEVGIQQKAQPYQEVNTRNRAKPKAIIRN